MRKRFVLGLFIILFTLLPCQANESTGRGPFLHSFLMLPDVADGLSGFLGCGIGYNLNPRFRIQVNGIYRKYKEKDEGIFNTSLYALFCDLEYSLNRKRLHPYLLISEGIIVVNRKRIFRMQPLWTYEAKETDFYFGLGTGVGVQFDLSKKISLYLEVRGYLLLYENDGIHSGGFYPIIGGLSFEL
jgi:opacity protein-like surface antigen